MRIANKDLHWLAGLLEGEGCFLLATTKACGYTYYHPRIDLSMTDEDIVKRAAKLLGSSYRPVKFRVRLKGGTLSKRTYKTNVYSTRAVEWMKRLLPILGKRRQKQINSVFAKRAKIRNRPWGKRHT